MARIFFVQLLKNLIMQKKIIFILMMHGQNFKKGIMADVLRNFSSKDLREYNRFYHNKIRNITRFTYPFTVDSKNELQKLGKIKMIKEKKRLIKKGGIFLTKTLITHGKVNKEITTKSDIIVSVS